MWLGWLSYIMPLHQVREGSSIEWMEGCRYCRCCWIWIWHPPIFRSILWYWSTARSITLWCWEVSHSRGVSCWYGQQIRFRQGTWNVEYINLIVEKWWAKIQSCTKIIWMTSLLVPPPYCLLPPPPPPPSITSRKNLNIILNTKLSTFYLYVIGFDIRSPLLLGILRLFLYADNLLLVYL